MNVKYQRKYRFQEKRRPDTNHFKRPKSDTKHFKGTQSHRAHTL